MLSGPPGRSLPELLRTAFYVECHVLDDPLFAITHEPSDANRAMTRALGVPDPKPDRPRICEILRFFRAVIPMVAADYVKFLPLSQIYEPPKEVFVHYSDNYFSDVLPPDTLAFFHQRARVRSLMRADVGWVVRPVLERSRGIAITFDEHFQHKAWIYHLHEARDPHYDRETGAFRFVPHLPDTLPDQAYFEAWVYQSINQCARQMHNELMREFATSATCSAVYLPQTKFAFDLLRTLDAPPIGAAGHTATSLLSLELPAFEDVDPALLMRVRTEDGEAFQNFRNALERGFADVRLENDTEQANKKVENLIRDLTSLKVDELDRRLAYLRTSAFAEASVAMLAMAGAICSAGATTAISLLATAAAAFQGFKTYQDYKSKVRENPAFFFWQLKDEKNGR